MKEAFYRVKVLSRLPRLQSVVYLSYLVVAMYVTWPLAMVFSTRLIGHPFGDTYEYIGLIWWMKHALQTGAPWFFQPLLVYPDGLSAALLWSIPLQSFPSWLFALVMPLPAAFNLSVLLTLALNGWAVFYLAVYLTGNRPAAWMAGLMFVAAPTFQGHLAAGHIGLLAQWSVALYIYTLFRLQQGSERRGVLWGSLFFVLSLLGSSVILIYELLPITAVFVLMVLFRRQWAVLRRMLATVFIGFLIGLIFLVPAALDTLSNSARADERGDIAFSADLLAVVSPSFQHPLFSALPYPHQVLGVDPFEKIAYVGIAAALLALIALWRKPATRWWLLLALVAWIGSLGPVLKVLDTPIHLSIQGYDTLVTLPWLAAQHIPLLDISRTPARFNFTLALSVAVLAGYGMSAVLDGLSAWRVGTRTGMTAKWLIVIVASVLILYEYPFFWKNGIPDMPTISGEVPPPIAALAQRSDIHAVFDIPWEHLLTDKEAMFLQTGHQHPLLAGHIARRTPVNPAKMTLLQQTLDLALLNDAGADIIILHKQWADSEGKMEAFSRTQLGEPFYEDDDYAVFNVPKTDAQPFFTTVLNDQLVVSDHADSYLYTPVAGWSVFTETIQGDGRDVILSLNGKLLHQWHVTGDMNVEVPLFLSDAGYYTVSLALAPPCRTSNDPALVCRSLSVTPPVFMKPISVDVAKPIPFVGGVTLNASHIVNTQQSVSSWLDWEFTAARTENDIRFVHVVDSQGRLVAQSDDSLGVQKANSGWSEAVNITLPPDLPAGEYHVYVGWYSYPDTTPFPILADVPNAASGSLEIGTFSIKP